IDAPTATVVKTGKNAYRMILPPDSSGQWMGERTNAAGVKQTRVGDLTAKKLSTRWTKFRYTSQGVLSTLAWMTSGAPSSALVGLSQPKVTDAGVRFDFTSQFAIPSKLQDVSINLRRAPGRNEVRMVESTFNISDDLYIGYGQDSTNMVYSRIFNQTNDNTCFDHTNTYPGSGSPTQNVSVGSHTCDNIQYANLQSNYGVSVYFDGSGNFSTLTYYLSYTPPPPSGQAPVTFSLTQLLMQWKM
ncbi:MAG: hypothetical protein ACR2KE_05670, partial [Candidatus Nanopelagicales bacterium]